MSTANCVYFFVCSRTSTFIRTRTLAQLHIFEIEFGIKTLFIPFIWLLLILQHVKGRSGMKGSTWRETDPPWPPSFMLDCWFEIDRCYSCFTTNVKCADEMKRIHWDFCALLQCVFSECFYHFLRYAFLCLSLLLLPLQIRMGLMSNAFVSKNGGRQQRLANAIQIFPLDRNASGSERIVLYAQTVRSREFNL